MVYFWIEIPVYFWGEINTNGVKLRVPIGADITQLRSLILLTQ